MKYLIVGLGNPGPKYELTRHNIGFLVLDRFVDRQKCPDFSSDRHGWVTECKHKGRTLYLLKPNTYMNLSGKAVNYWLQELKLNKDNLLVIVDDVALPFGTLRMRAKGSSAGHNGLKDIEGTLGGSNYPRLRFGIGQNFYKGKQIEYVLSKYNQEELDQLPEIMDRAGEMILSFASVGINQTMSNFND